MSAATTVWLVVGIKDDGSVVTRLGGGSSSPATPRVYPTREQAERYWKDGQRAHSRKWMRGERDMTIRLIPVGVEATP